MQIIIHRANTVAQLRKIPQHYGVEIDVRANGNDLILNHEPFQGGERLADYLQAYQHAFIIFNIKEAGIEQRVMDLAAQHNITDYFLLDVEFPFIYRAARAGVRRIAMRYSEDEAIETVLRYKPLVDWVWIDTNTQLPLTPAIAQQLQGFKTCLVCPERWGRPQDIPIYIDKLRQLQFPLNAVMTRLDYAPQWEKY